MSGSAEAPPYLGYLINDGFRRAVPSESCEPDTLKEEAMTEVDYKNVTVCTTDLHQEYEIIGPVYFQVSNKGLFSSQLGKLKKAYSEDIAASKKGGQIGEAKIDWGFLYGEYSAGQSDFEHAFFIAVQELKKRAAMLGADAVVGMRQDIDMDTNAFQYFYLQMYGTAIRRK
jgi:hypothetical protein